MPSDFYMSLQECLALKPKSSFYFVKKYSLESGSIFVLVNGFALYFWVGGIIDLPNDNLDISIINLGNKHHMIEVYMDSQS